MIYNINDIKKILGVAAHNAEDNAALIEHIAIDSRKIHFPHTTIFFALKGIHNDGHVYVPSLFKKGVRNFVVSQPFSGATYASANFIVVPDTLCALQELCGFHRKKFTYPVIAITGSNGKTIVKEWLFHLLNTEFEIVRSPKSYNSQVGVPLSLWQMDDVYDLGIFEAGISRPGEMAGLQQMIDPQLGVFTFLGAAHAEGFETLQHKAREKLQLFKNSKVLFYCADEKVLHHAVQEFRNNTNSALELFSWSRTADTPVKIEDIVTSSAGSTVRLKFKNELQEYFFAFTDEASIHNAITCITVLLFLEIPAAGIAEKLLQLRPVEMRLELKQGNNNCSIINDGYSADINSLNIALHFLEQQQQHTARTVILSDFLQSGKNADLLYREIAAILQHRNLFRFVGIGEHISAHSHHFEKIRNSSFFESTGAFLKALPTFHFSGESILLKGARPFKFEKISSALEQKLHQTFLEINLNALRHNVKIYRQQLLPGVKLMCMVKAFSYGSGSYEIANLLQHIGVDYLAVAYADEGVDLRKAGITIPTMVMNTEEAGFDNLIRYQLEPELYSFKILHAFNNYLQLHDIESHPVHIKINTGMNRLGFDGQDVDALCNILKSCRQFKICSVFSHLAGGGDAYLDDFTATQALALQDAAAKITGAVGYDIVTHIANSSAIHRHKNLQMGMVRLGIGMYGVDEDMAMQQRLQNVTTLKTTISQIRKIQKGESVGYGRSTMVDEDKLIATVRIGYADGYPRILSNGRGYMLVNGEAAPVIGRICMDMTMLDVTGLDAQEEDEVIVFGEQLPVKLLAAWAQTIEYEILTNISQRVRRIYFEE